MFILGWFFLSVEGITVEKFNMPYCLVNNQGKNNCIYDCLLDCQKDLVLGGFKDDCIENPKLKKKPK